MEIKKISHRKQRRKTYDVAVAYRYDVDGGTHGGTSSYGPRPFDSQQQAMSALDVERAIGDSWKNIGMTGFVSLPALAGVAASIVGVLGIRKQLRNR